MSNNPQSTGNKREIKLHMPQDMNAVYSNLALISSTKNELIFDFAQMLPPDPRAKVQARVVMSPQHAKLLLNSLQRNLERYEAQHGTIPFETPPTLADQLFGNVSGDDDGDNDDNN